MKRVYVAGPMSAGDKAFNIRNAMKTAAELMEAGYAVYLPHLSHFMQMSFPQPYERWLAMDLEWLKVCDAFIRLPGVSRGADKEEVWAKGLGLPVYRSVADLLWADSKPDISGPVREAMENIGAKFDAIMNPVQVYGPHDWVRLNGTPLSTTVPEQFAHSWKCRFCGETAVIYGAPGPPSMDNCPKNLLVLGHDS